MFKLTIIFVNLNTDDGKLLQYGTSKFISTIVNINRDDGNLS